MKKKFLKPTIQVVTLQMQGLICTSPVVTNVGSNAGFNSEIKSGSGPARGRSFDDWNDYE